LKDYGDPVESMCLLLTVTRNYVPSPGTTITKRSHPKEQFKYQIKIHMIFLGFLYPVYYGIKAGLFLFL